MSKASKAVFATLKEAQIVIENWQQHYNKEQPHSSLKHRSHITAPTRHPLRRDLGRCPLMALSRHFVHPVVCQLSGVKRTYLTHAPMSAFDRYC